MLKNIMFPIKLNVHKCACGVEFAIIGLSNNCKDIWPHQGYAYCPYCGIANASQQAIQADADVFSGFCPGCGFDRGLCQCIRTT